MTRFLVAVYFIETGLLLVIAPWTIWWRRNFFAEMVPWLQTLMASPASRIAVVATGLVTVLAGLSDVRDLLSRRLVRQAAPDTRPPEL